METGHSIQLISVLSVEYRRVGTRPKQKQQIVAGFLDRDGWPFRRVHVRRGRSPILPSLLVDLGRLSHTYTYTVCVV